MGVIITRTVGGGIASGGAYTQTEKLAIQMEQEFIAIKPYAYKELIYTVDDLTNVGWYEDNTKAVKLFNKDLKYSDGKLSRTDLTRISDGAKLTRIFNYTGNNLTSVETSGSY